MMAKKQLKRAEVPPGQRLVFFDFVQLLVLRHGDRSVSQLAQELGYSHQAIYKTLTGPKMPSQQIVTRLAKHLGGEDAVREALDRWTRGVEEQRTTPQPDDQEHLTPRDGTVYGGVEWASEIDADEAASPRFTPRETEILELYASGASVKEIAGALGIAQETVNTHLKSIRNRYAAVNLPTGRWDITQHWSRWKRRPSASR